MNRLLNLSVKHRWIMLITGILIFILIAGIGVMFMQQAKNKEVKSYERLIYFDLKSFLDEQPSSQLAYDYLKLATALQGLVNRHDAGLFYRFESNEIATEAGVDIDKFWLQELSKPGKLLADRPITDLDSFEELIHTFAEAYEGVVVWDGDVPATANVASTAAGVDGLLPVRYDLSPNSPYHLLVNQLNFPIKLDLVDKFTGEGTIPDVDLPSTGSAKNDAYHWAKAMYLDKGKTNPALLAYALDAVSWNFSNMDAQWESIALPTKMQVGSTAAVQLSVVNTGPSEWAYAYNDRVATTENGENDFLWSDYESGYSIAAGDQRIFLKENQIVQPSETLQLSWTITAPDTVGTYTWSIQMVREGVSYFGEPLAIAIEVVADAVSNTPILEEFAVEMYSYPDLFNSMLPNADYFIANKAFFFDLSPDERSYPNDDREQPLGTDYETLIALLEKQNELAGEQIITLGGFVPWWIKYTNHADIEASLEPVAAEWKFADIISRYNIQKDADAYGLVGLSNASVYQHEKLIELKQSNEKGNNGKTYDPNTKYIAFYMGDYDAGAWTAGALPVLWNDPKRGELPLAWAPVPGLSKRVPQVFNYLYETATANDYFVAGDNGAGYLNPMMLLEENRPEGLPDYLHVWEAYNKKYYEQHDLDITGFLISGNSTKVDKRVQEAYSRFSPAGVGNNAEFDETVVNGTPFFKVQDTLLSPITADSHALANELSNIFTRKQQFTFLRTILFKPATIVDAVEEVRSLHPELKFEVVDPYTFFRFYKESLER